MANYVIAKRDTMRFDQHKKLKCEQRVWRDDEIEALLGIDFEIMDLKSGDVMYMEKGWDADVSDLPINSTATSVSGIRIRGDVLICEPEECHKS